MNSVKKLHFSLLTAECSCLIFVLNVMSSGDSPARLKKNVRTTKEFAKVIRNLVIDEKNMYGRELLSVSTGAPFNKVAFPWKFLFHQNIRSNRPVSFLKNHYIIRTLKKKKERNVLSNTDIDHALRADVAKL